MSAKSAARSIVDSAVKARAAPLPTKGYESPIEEYSDPEDDYEEESEEEEPQPVKKLYDSEIEVFETKIVRKEGKLYVAIIDPETNTVLKLTPVEAKKAAIKGKSSSATKQ